ncbi:putative WD repeat-containing protein [Neolecta irregularis DAH-3]|uniref:Putative WD repeat-containing protein n=1 Tax=Neolecta irregularis (strain DAH-3) TaxID=1198029 RepID=A0A1U7LTD9_NEOID|nr:putative WD repeat-containing protein [Neolecta irregularis DAH-3]|eukprot:OLL25927.1 putative WD repeat-containing protein [Neolecta irregularis DAH-3]
MDDRRSFFLRKNPLNAEFVILDTKGKEVTLYKIVQNEYTHDVYFEEELAKRVEVGATCLAWSPLTVDLIAYGTRSGTAYLQRLVERESSIPLDVKHQRPCTTISFSQNFLATGLDKVRNDYSLVIWDIERTTSNPSSRPESSSRESVHHGQIVQFAYAETICSLGFLDTNEVVAGASKALRIYDFRGKVFLNTWLTNRTPRTSLEVSGNFFASSSDDGSVAVWDRRSFREPVLQFNKASAEEHGRTFPILDLRIENGTLAILNSNGMIKAWEIIEEKSSKVYRVEERSETLAQVWRTADVPSNSEGMDRIRSFDWILDSEFPDKKPNKILTIHDNSSIQTEVIFKPLRSFSVNPYNSITISRQENLVSFKVTPRNPNLDEWDIDSSEDEDALKPQKRTRPGGSCISPTPNAAIQGINKTNGILDRDVSSRMKRKAEIGYSMDPSKNMDLSIDQPERDLWMWLSLAQLRSQNGSLKSGQFNLSFQGVWGIWFGVSGANSRPSSTRDQMRYTNGPTNDNAYLQAVTDIVHRYPNRIFCAVPSRIEQRQLSLILCGWDFALPELEEKLQAIESRKEYEKAAAWACFHGDIDRCIRSLSQGTDKLKLMSTAVAGHLNTKTNKNPIWRDLCRKLSNELEEPYLRAIYAFIANGEWRDVLDDAALPLRDRLGIALRFLDDEDLSNYLLTLGKEVITSGDFEGVYITGLTPEFGDLLQIYVDRTGDVQTAALVCSFAKKLDDRFNIWIESYRELLNSWRLFYQRSKFDIERGKISRMNGNFMKTERGFVVRCNHCDQSITHIDDNIRGKRFPQMYSRNGISGLQHINKSTHCPNCNKPLPRCALCLLPLGVPPIETTEEFPAEKSFNICLGCSHGMHAGHSRAWFEKHETCAVPDCDCRCSRRDGFYVR